jgi:hypothetical protein
MTNSLWIVVATYADGTEYNYKNRHYNSKSMAAVQQRRWAAQAERNGDNMTFRIVEYRPVQEGE